MNKTILLTLLLPFTPLVAVYGQSNYTIKGTLCDSLTRQPEAYATVRLLEVPSMKPLKANTTQLNGKFSITASKPGKYVLELMSIGKAPVRRQIALAADKRVFDTDTLYIKEYNSTLGVATVTAQRPLVKAELDKLTYSIADDPDAKTNTVLEMLRKVPMVTVDGEDNIKVNGNASFKVYVDGKPNQMMSANPSMIFKAYPASAIQKIEVITNPGAKYDAEGVAGVLNIITNTKTSTSGYTVTANASVGNRGEMGSLMGMAQFGKFMISAHYGAGYHDQPNTTTNVERELYGENASHLLKSDTESSSHGIFQFGNLDASYEFTEKDLLSVSAGIHGWNGRNSNTSLNQMFRVDGSPYYSYHVASKTKSLYRSINASADYQHAFTDDTKLTMSYRYDNSPQTTKVKTWNDQLTNLPESFGLKDLDTDPDNLSYEHTAQVDFTTPLDKKKTHTLATGVKYIRRVNRSNSVEYSRPAGSDAGMQLDEERSLRYRHTGNIAAAYLEYNLKKGKWTAMAGSRYEYYKVDVSYPDGKREAFGTHMSDWVPSISAGFNLSDSKMLKAGYNMRIGRPDISYLSPYKVSYSPEAVTYGNPDLKSEKSHNLDLTYSMFGPKLTFNASLNYSFSNNGMVSYSFVDENGVANTTYGGFQHSKMTMLSTYINWTVVKGTTINLNASASYSDYKAHVLGSHNSGYSADLWGGLQQTMPWKLKLGLWLGGNTRQVTLQGKAPGFFFYSLSLSRSFLKEDCLGINLRAGNFIGRYTHFRTSTVTNQMRYVSDTRNDMMRLSIGVSYRLGSLKSGVKKVDRSIENDDVMRTGNSSGASGDANAGGGQQ